MPAVDPPHFFPGPSPAVARSRSREFVECCAEPFLRHRDRNCRWCSPGRAPANGPLPRAPRPRPAILPGTVARNRRCSPDPSAPSVLRMPAAAKGKCRSGSSRFSAAAIAPPISIAFSSRSRCRVPPPAPAKAAGPQFRSRSSSATARPPASTRPPAAGRWFRTAPSPLRRTNIWKEARAAPSSSGCRARPPRIRTRIVREGNESACGLLGLALSVLDATESCVDVSVMRLEPVSERRPQHARGRARRTALHDVVFPVKKIRGIAGIERHRRKAGEGCELRSRPFPPVAQQVLHSECARAFRMRARRGSIPMGKIEITMLRARRFFAPGIASLRFAFRGALPRALKLPFRRQLPPQPFCVRCRFCVARVHGPIKRQPDFLEHGAVHPQISVTLPYAWLLDPPLSFPRPSSPPPDPGVFVPACLDEAQKIAVRHVARINREFADLDYVVAHLVVPTDFVAVNLPQP